jgi:hypothetical protein
MKQAESNAPASGEMKPADNKDMKAGEHKDMKPADSKDMKAGGHKDMKAGEHHKHHGHHHHHHHADHNKSMGMGMAPEHEAPTTDKNYNPKNLGDSEHAPMMPGKTSAWGSHGQTTEPVKQASYTAPSTKSWGEDWWSKEYRDQGKGGLASATPGSPDGEMSK